MTPAAAKQRAEWLKTFDEAAKVRRLAGTIWRTGTSVEEWLRKVRGGNKWCSACRAWHPIAYFYEDVKQPDALKGPCRAAILKKLEDKRRATERAIA